MKYMRTSFFLFCSLFIYGKNYSQVYKQVYNDRSIAYQQMTTRDVENSRYLFNLPMNGYIVDVNDSVYYYKEFNLDLTQNKLCYYQGKSTRALNIKAKEFAFAVKGLVAKDSMIVFQNGFKSKGDKNGSRFYEVIYGGNVKLLKYFRPEEVKKEYSAGNMTPEFEIYNEYYVFFKNQLYPLNKTRQEIANFLNGVDPAVEDYFVNNKLDPTDQADLVKLAIALDRSPATH